MRIQWLSGNTSLKSEFFRFSDAVQNVSSDLQYRAEEGEQIVTCRAELLTEGGEVWRSRRTNVSLQIHCES